MTLLLGLKPPVQAVAWACSATGRSSSSRSGGRGRGGGGSRARTGARYRLVATLRSIACFELPSLGAVAYLAMVDELLPLALPSGPFLVISDEASARALVLEDGSLVGFVDLCAESEAQKAQGDEDEYEIGHSDDVSELACGCCVCKRDEAK